MKVSNTTKIIVLLLVIMSICNPWTLEGIVNYLDKISNSDNFSIISDETSDIEAYGDLVSDDEALKSHDTEITGTNYQFDTQYYPYYSFLSDSEKKLYKQIYANANALVEEFVPSDEVTVASVKQAFEAVYNDHPELFWLNTSYSYKYTINDRCVKIILSFNETADDIEKHKKLFDTEVSKIVQYANTLGSDYEKEKYVHDILINNITYDKKANMNQSAYSAIVMRRTICAGYARAFQYIMIQLKIPTYYCVGVSSVNHAWNIVKLDDGYYNVDLTWDDNKTDKYKYFNRTDKDFSSSHRRTGLSTNLPKCSATRYRYKNENESRLSLNNDILTSDNTNNTTNSNIEHDIIKIDTNIVDNSSIIDQSDDKIINNEEENDIIVVSDEDNKGDEYNE